MSSNAITISGSTYTVAGTVKNKETKAGIVDLHVSVYDKDLLKDDFLGIAVTDKTGAFKLTFNAAQFKSLLDRSPDLYFIVEDYGLVVLNTKDAVIKNANASTPPINLEVDISNDKLRPLINETPVAGWKGGFVDENPAFAYPTADLSSLKMEKNRTNIDKLQRQQKVLWPEFSWETEPGAPNPMRCYQMFAPDISRLGYTAEGKVYSIICPQQGACSKHFGCMNVEVTVTGNRGWANEANKEIAADMTVEGKIWFSPSAHEFERVQQFANHFKNKGLPFPSNKANAIVVSTHKKGDKDQPIFPLRIGPSTDFDIPNFAKHEGIAWSMASLEVQIGPIVKTGVEEVDRFNQFVLDIFNTASGNMLKNGNVLSWNVWFTAPELVDQEEWTKHTEVWRESIDADHGSPDGNGTIARYIDGTPFKPLQHLLDEELMKIVNYIKDHL